MVLVLFFKNNITVIGLITAVDAISLSKMDHHIGVSKNIDDKVPVKNTFIHYNINKAKSDFAASDNGNCMKRSKSAPSLNSETKPDSSSWNYNSNYFRPDFWQSRPQDCFIPNTQSCSPCAFYLGKRGNCDKGDACERCHTCIPPPEKRKTKKWKELTKREKKRLSILGRTL